MSRFMNGEYRESMRHETTDWKGFLAEINAMIEDPKYAFKHGVLRGIRRRVTGH